MELEKDHSNPGLGFSLTVLDEKPDTVICALMSEWEQPVKLDETRKALLEKASDYICKLYQGQPTDNTALIRIGVEVDTFMQIHCTERYTGRVRIRRGRKEGHEYRYRYVV